MYAPHTASLINQHGQDYYLTILRGVMIQDMERRSVLQAGDYDASYTKIFIPFGSMRGMPRASRSRTCRPGSMQRVMSRINTGCCRRTVMKPVGAAFS